MAPKELNVQVQMMDMAIHGHVVADEEILKTAQHRHPPRWYDQLFGIYGMIKVKLNNFFFRVPLEANMLSLSRTTDLQTHNEL